MAEHSVNYLPPRNGLIWLVVALSVSIMPLIPELPFWLLAVWLCVGLWRVQLYRGIWRMPGGMTKLVLVSVCSAGLFLTFGRFAALEPMVSLFVCGALLKLLEMKNRRDAQLLLYLCYFLVSCRFLFTQGLSDLMIGSICLWVVTTALLVMHQPRGHETPKRSLRLAGRLLLHSVPLMVLLFLVMPRIGSLWNIPLQDHGATTGVSDSMSPGDFSSLSRSGGVAFRVTFNGARPRPEDLYWRGLIFSEFDGRRWSPSRNGPGTDGESWIRWGRNVPNKAMQKYSEDSEQPLGRPVNYEIIMEPTQQHWLYSLMLTTEFYNDSDVKILRTTNQRLVADQPIRQRMVYSASSSLDYTTERRRLPDIVRDVNLKLPSNFNPVALRSAEEWRRQAGSDQAYVDRVLAFFNASFVYTLEPPRLGKHTVDEFMWGTQQGFCEHYASSFVVMMRAAGIPARVVAGYLGGEYNAAENYYVVHQYDAHAWAEIWLPDRGWVRQDPTAAVAPERVLQSLGDLQADLVESPWALGRYRNLTLFNNLRLQWDALNYRWHRSVMGFDDDRQSQFFNNWLNGATPLKLVLFVLGGGAVAFALMGLHLWWGNRKGPMVPALKVFHRLQSFLARRGLERASGEAVGDFLRRVAAEKPEAKVLLMQFNRTFEDALYGNGLFHERELKRLLRSLRRAL